MDPYFSIMNAMIECLQIFTFRAGQHACMRELTGLTDKGIYVAR